MEQLRRPAVAPGVLVLSLVNAQVQAEVLRDMGRALALARSRRPLAMAQAMNAVESAMLTASDAGLAEVPGKGTGSPLARLLERLDGDLAHPWSVARMAAIAGLSPSRFAHVFRRSYGETPRRYLERRRLEQAAARLRTTSLPCYQIARELGFDDIVQFTRRFRAWYGHPPGRWRTGNGGPR